MKRSGFARQPPKPAKVYESHTPRVRPVAKATARLDQQLRQMPKDQIRRDLRYRDACRAMPCQHCGNASPMAGVTWAHSNWSEHGKAMARKASDEYVAALCWLCHRWLDQGAGSAEVKRAMWEAAHARTVALGRQLGIWPGDAG